MEVCPYDVYAKDKKGRVYIVNPVACVGCSICVENCPNNAITISPTAPEELTKGLWTFQTVEEIHYKAETGKYLVRGYGKMGPMPHFDDLIVVPAQLASPVPKDKYREPCNTEVMIGEGRVEKPLRLSVPVMFGAMSFGAISKEAKMALAIGAAKIGTATNTGEGGSFPEEYTLAHGFEDEEALERGWKKYEPGGYLIVQYSTGRWGVSRNYLQRSDAIEIKIGQGAKPGMGGHLLGEKVTEEIARIRGLPIGTDALSPSRFYDVRDIKDFGKQIALLRDLTNYEKPIILKLGPGRVYQDVRMAAELGVDAIAVDGMQGGTGASPQAVTQTVGIPTIACIPQAVRALKDTGLRGEVKLIALGGIRSGADVVKALALGADCVGIASSAMIAMGCRACMACSKGKCTYGIATQDPRLRERLKPEIAGQRLYNFLRSIWEEIKMLTMLTGKGDIRKLSKEDLRALNINVAAITGVKLIGLGEYISKDWKSILGPREITVKARGLEDT